MHVWRIVVARRYVLYAAIACNGIATRGVEPLHALVESRLRVVQVNSGRAYARVAEHCLDVVQRPAVFQQPTPALMTQVAELKVGTTEYRLRPRVERV